MRNLRRPIHIKKRRNRAGLPMCIGFAIMLIDSVSNFSPSPIVGGKLDASAGRLRPDRRLGVAMIGPYSSALRDFTARSTFAAVGGMRALSSGRSEIDALRRFPALTGIWSAYPPLRRGHRCAAGAPPRPSTVFREWGDPRHVFNTYSRAGS